jgi:hypothetical protein
MDNATENFIRDTSRHNSAQPRESSDITNSESPGLSVSNTEKSTTVTFDYIHLFSGCRAITSTFNAAEIRSILFIPHPSTKPAAQSPI